MSFITMLQNAARGRNAMQQDAQAALPVIPNNGNPGGVYNAPQTGGVVPPQSAPIPQTGGNLPPTQAPNVMQTGGNQAPQHFYPWMRPSPHMDAIRQMLGQRMQTVDEQPVMRRDGGMILPQRR